MIAAVRRIPFALAALVGLGLLVTLLAVDQLGAARAGDAVIDEAATIVTEEDVARIRADLEGVQATATAFDGPGLDRLAELDGRSREALLGEAARRFPRLAAARAAAPEVLTLADTVVGNLEVRVDQVAAAAELPGFGAQLEDAVRAELVLAGVLLVVGLAGLARPGRVVGLVLLGLALAMVVLPLALGHPGKAGDTDAVLESLRPFSREKVEAREAGLRTARDLFDGYERDLAGLVAARAGTTSATVLGELAAESPALDPAARAEVRAALGRFEELVAFSARIQPRLVETDTMSASTAMWLVLGPGIVLLGAYAGAAAVTASASRRTPSSI